MDSTGAADTGWHPGRLRLGIYDLPGLVCWGAVMAQHSRRPSSCFERKKLRHRTHLSYVGDCIEPNIIGGKKHLLSKFWPDELDGGL
jgi:hypothetical protein